MWFNFLYLKKILIKEYDFRKAKTIIKMQKFSIARFRHLTKRSFHLSQNRLQDVDLKKNLIYGGDLKVSLPKGPIGSILFNRLSEKGRADKIIQVCASSGKEMTTSNFLVQSISVARGLREREVNNGDFVIVLGNNSLNLNVTMIGIIFLGAVAVPVSHLSNPDDLRVMLKFIQPKFFITDSDSLFTLIRICTDVFGEFDTSKAFILNNNESLKPGVLSFPEFIAGKDKNWEAFKPTEIENTTDELALVMKALAEGAGSRGVGLTHENIKCVIARYVSEQDSQGIASEVILMVQKIIWMSGIYTLMLSCYFGSKMIVMGEFDEETFMKNIQNFKVTWCFLYPGKIWQLYKYPYAEEYDLSSCKKIYGIGARLPRVLIRGMKERTGLTLIPAYGITEMCGMITQHDSEPKEGSIGKLVPQCFAKVIAVKDQQPSGPNTPGELCFKGPMLMKGYVNDEKATREAMDKEGFLHSGDYGSFDEDGYFYIVDRMKQVITYKNYQLSPQEIEGMIKTMDPVKDCVVGGISHPTDGYRVIAFVVIEPNKTVTAEEIIKHIEGKLPEQKHLTGGVVFIPKVPRSRETGVIKRNSINKILSKYIYVDDKVVDKQAAEESMKVEAKKRKSKS